MYEDGYKQLMNEVLELKDTSYKFEYAIGIFVSHMGEYENSETECLMKIQAMDSTKESYILFYALCTFYRRNKRFLDMDTLLKKYETCFHKYQSFEYLKLLCDMNKYKYEDQQYLIKRAEHLCDTWNKNDINEKNLNIKHAFSEIVANIYELMPSYAFMSKNTIDRAYTYVKQLCSDSENGIYAKYYCTKARIYVLKASVTEDTAEAAQFYTEALEAIDIALREEPYGSQFLIRIGEYERYGAMIKSKYEMFLMQNSIMQKYDEQIQSLKDSSSKTVELLGLFTAVIALIIGTLQIIVNFTYFQAACLIILLGGIMLIIYAALEILLHSFTKRECAIMALGGCMVVSMLLISCMIQ